MNASSSLLYVVNVKLGSWAMSELVFNIQERDES